MAPNDGPSIWRESFSDESRKAQVEDDSAAWHAVTGLLLAIITTGVCLAIFTVWMTS